MVIQVSFFTFLFACVYVFVTISEGYVSKHEKGLLKDMYFPPFIWSHCSSSVKNISFFFFCFFFVGFITVGGMRYVLSGISFPNFFRF